MTGQLTTHVLDTAQGRPAVDLAIELWQIELWQIEPGKSNQDSHRTLLTTVRTNQDGRTDFPLLLGKAFQPGVYELVFSVGEYFARHGLELPDPAFLDRVPIQFGISDRAAHYHVPLLVSPWCYSTYRGS